jgi:sugar lactone lactonase YvrE
MTGIVFGEQPRWHDGRLWFSDWGTQEVIAVDLDGSAEVMHRGSSFPLCVDWLPDGRLLVVDTSTSRLLVQEANGSLETYADLRQGSDPPAGNELVVNGRGNTYVNGGGFDLMAGEPYAPGGVVLVTPDGTARQVADGLAFPNGMAVTGDNQTLIVGESYAKQLTAYEIADDGSLANRRVWAELGDGVPDGICIDARRSGLVRRGAEQTLRTRPRRRRRPRHSRPRPRRLRVRARRARPTDPLHPRYRVERSREHVQGRKDRKATHRHSARRSGGLAGQITTRTSPATRTAP